ncbi:hypothetical protein ACN6K9_006490 [Streptomyces sp. SAS_267]|uniref:hypothetical protein n=1 Tax=unclassified Streptomyces TaxID=2593676 RepID=UPI0036FEA244
MTTTQEAAYRADMLVADPLARAEKSRTAVIGPVVRRWLNGAGFVDPVSGAVKEDASHGGAKVAT